MITSASNETPKPKKKRAKKAVPPPIHPDRVTLDPTMAAELKRFVFWAIGDGHLTVFEDNFLNTMKRIMHRETPTMTEKQWRVLNEIKDKLHFDRPHDPLPPNDLDGIEENDDPDGWPVEREAPVDDEPTWLASIRADEE